MLWQPSLPERYTRMPAADLAREIDDRRARLTGELAILGHHYQVDEIIRHADLTGDSLKLSQEAADLVERQPGIRTIIFCGVHFMAETADVLTPEHVRVILPDLSAGCSMADMAQYDDTVEAWDAIHESLAAQGWRGRVVPITYVNSSAAIKAFVGERGGACCTSSNADAVFDWAMRGGDEPLAEGEDVKILFLPDQHLGRNTAAKYGLDVRTQTCLYDPKRTDRGEARGGASEDEVLRSKVILWAGHCSVHKLFRPEHCDEIRAENEELIARGETPTRILVHPECCKEVVDKADLAGSTEFIIRQIEAAEAGTRWAVGTEIHLVNRLAKAAEARGVSVRILSDCQCLCTTMYRIDEPHLLWVLDNLCGVGTKDGEAKVVNQVSVHPEARRMALMALERMLKLGPVMPATAGV
ncbi:MAG: quinolinate synthase NadA [Phycisphaerales bacterium]|nr:MAG: quinolinate synthase NadA [Phycisphaerales bacterium]